MRNCLVVGAKRYTDIKSFTYIQVPEDERNSIMLGLEDMQWDKKDLVKETERVNQGSFATYLFSPSRKTGRLSSTF